MRPYRFVALVGCCLVAGLGSCSRPGGEPAAAPDPLPSWNEGAARRAIVSFVGDVTTPDSPSFVPERDRIAVFDNDGTLWSETPVYVQLAFVMDRVAALEPEHPEWRTEDPFRAVLERDREALSRLDHHDVLELVLATHGGMTTDEFDATVRAWLRDARHPVRNRPYTDLAYRPMLELLDYLRANGFKTFIVSGGGIDFMRPWTQEVYGIPPEQVVGSSIEVRYAVEDGRPVLERLPQVYFIDDGAG
jgi:phosphoglycolate phosphatase-like HAD superfamily hydrolase